MVGIPVEIQFDETLVKMVVLGIAFGLTGRLFSVSLAYLKKYWRNQLMKNGHLKSYQEFFNGNLKGSP